MKGIERKIVDGQIFEKAANLWLYLHYHWLRNLISDLQNRISEIDTPQFGLESATRLHEAGIASNRGSERHGEYVPGSCTHRPSRHGSQ